MATFDSSSLFGDLVRETFRLSRAELLTTLQPRAELEALDDKGNLYLEREGDRGPYYFVVIRMDVPGFQLWRGVRISKQEKRATEAYIGYISTKLRHQLGILCDQAARLPTSVEVRYFRERPQESGFPDEGETWWWGFRSADSKGADVKGLCTEQATVNDGRIRGNIFCDLGAGHEGQHHGVWEEGAVKAVINWTKAREFTLRGARIVGSE